MKKRLIRSVIIPLLVAITLGFYGAKIAYDFYQVKKTIRETDYNAFAVQYGAYTSIETLKKGLEGIDNYVVSTEDGKYYVYLGFTTNPDNLSKIRHLYEKEDREIYTKKLFINNSEFVSSLEQFDVLLASANEEDDISSINNAILSSYDEIILGN